MATPRLPRTWYFWGSAIFGLLAHGAMLLAQMLTLVAVVIRYGDAEPSEAALKVLLHQGGVIAAATFICMSGHACSVVDCDPNGAPA